MMFLRWSPIDTKRDKDDEKKKNCWSKSMNSLTLRKVFFGWFARSAIPTSPYFNSLEVAMQRQRQNAMKRNEEREVFFLFQLKCIAIIPRNLLQVTSATAIFCVQLPTSYYNDIHMLLSAFMWVDRLKKTIQDHKNIQFFFHIRTEQNHPRTKLIA